MATQSTFFGAVSAQLFAEIAAEEREAFAKAAKIEQRKYEAGVLAEDRKYKEGREKVKFEQGAAKREADLAKTEAETAYIEGGRGRKVGLSDKAKTHVKILTDRLRDETPGSDAYNKIMRNINTIYDSVGGTSSAASKRAALEAEMKAIQGVGVAPAAPEAPTVPSINPSHTGTMQKLLSEGNLMPADVTALEQQVQDPLSALDSASIEEVPPVQPMPSPTSSINNKGDAFAFVTHYENLLKSGGLMGADRLKIQKQIQELKTRFNF